MHTKHKIAQQMELGQKIWDHLFEDGICDRWWVRWGRHTTDLWKGNPHNDALARNLGWAGGPVQRTDTRRQGTLEGKGWTPTIIILTLLWQTSRVVGAELT